MLNLNTLSLGTRFARRLARRHRLNPQNCDPDRQQWRTDPFSDPDIRKMNMRELADLPMPHIVSSEERGFASTHGSRSVLQKRYT